MRIRTPNDWALARRDLLKYLGVGAACLPLLNAGRARAAGKVTDRKLVILHTSEGYRMQYWKPASTGPLTTLPETLTPFEKHKQDVIVMPNMNNVGFGTGASGGHGSYGSIYYGLEPGKVSYKKPKGSTFDQHIAANMPKNASGRQCLPLHIQLERSPQSNPSSPASNRCFFINGQPVNPIGNPYMVYNEIFAGKGMATPAPMPGMPNAVDMAATEKLMLRKKSILDYVGKNLEAFKNRLGTEDKKAIELHHQSVRDLEMQLSGGGAGAGPLPTGAACDPKSPAMIDVNDPKQYPNILDAHLTLIVHALGCGITRIASVQTSDSSGNNIDFGFVPGVPLKGTGYKSAARNYHDLGHNPVLGGVDHKKIVDKWFMQQWANLLDRMKATPDGEGTLLSNSIVLMGNHMQDGSNHDANHIPWLTAGSAAGFFKTGHTIAEGKPTNGLMTEICNAFEVKSIYGYDLAEIRAT
jgi:hypothetical protein